MLLAFSLGLEVFEDLLAVLLFLLVVALEGVDEATSSALEHVVGKRDVKVAVLPLRQALKELLDRLRLLSALGVPQDRQELIELNAARTVLVYQVDQLLHLFDCVNESESDERELHLLKPDRPRAIIVQATEARLQGAKLAIKGIGQ